MKTKEEPMGVFMAVFNGHVNDANTRARIDFVNKFGSITWGKIMQPLIDDGIMVIFDKDPTEHTKFYAEQVAKYVNQEEEQQAPKQKTRQKLIKGL